MNGTFLTPFINEGIISVALQSAGFFPTLLLGYPRFAVGADAGGPATVTVYNPDQSVAATLTPFPDSPGGVRVAEADFNGDGIPDLAVGTGPGAIAGERLRRGYRGHTV